VSVLENITENVGASFQENKSQVDKVYTIWSVCWKQQDNC